MHRPFPGASLAFSAFLLLSVPLTAEAVEPEWVSWYGGPGHRIDSPCAVAVGPDGEVCVTGYSRGAETHNDYATVKYDSDGNERWARRYSYIGRTEDWPYANAVDSLGNVYVTGRSPEDSSHYYRPDIATIKYRPDGTEAWVARFDRTGMTRDDEPRDLAVDRHGNVYVTGGSVTDSTDNDYCTLKYDSAGVLQWARFHTSYSEGWSEFPDIAFAIAVDARGRVYVTGNTQPSGATTICYDADGNEQWHTSTLPVGAGTDVCVDEASSVFVTGVGDGPGVVDLYTFKLDSCGNLRWLVRYDGTGHWYDERPKMVMDDSCNVYVTARSMGAGTSWDFATIKYDSAGNELWVARYDGPASRVDWVQDLATDSKRLYVVGSSERVRDTADFCVVCYDLDGNELWVARYISPAPGGEGSANAVAVDSEGHACVGGSCVPVGDSLRDFVTMKFRPDGVGVAEHLPSAAPGPVFRSTIARGTLQQSAGQTAHLLDITGRRVMDLPGALASEASGAARHHDIRHLAPGVYFLRSAVSGDAVGGGEATRSAVRKVIIQR